MVLISGLVWIITVYIRYVIRKQKILQKMNQVRRVPSDALALIGLTILTPFTVQSRSNDDSTLSTIPKNISEKCCRAPTCGQNYRETMEIQLLNYV